jgi:hypothetical protein
MVLAASESVQTKAVLDSGPVTADGDIEVIFLQTSPWATTQTREAVWVVFLGARLSVAVVQEFETR